MVQVFLCLQFPSGLDNSLPIGSLAFLQAIALSLHMMNVLAFLQPMIICLSLAGVVSGQMYPFLCSSLINCQIRSSSSLFRGCSLQLITPWVLECKTFLLFLVLL